MTEFNWTLKHATATNNYQLQSEDGTTQLMDGVITNAVLTLTATNGSEEATHPFINVPLAAPVPDAFAPLDNVEKSVVLEWALNQLPERMKENLQEALRKRVEGTAPVNTTIFSD